LTITCPKVPRPSKKPSEFTVVGAATVPLLVNTAKLPGAPDTTTLVFAGDAEFTKAAPGLTLVMPE
jgi:hypothetical protein